MNYIIYATDFSKNSLSALKYAYAFREESGAELIVLHVSDYPTLWVSPNSQSETIDEVEKSILNHNISKLREFYKNAIIWDASTENVRFEVKENKNVVQGIIDMIEECNADLVVLGIKGESKVRELLMGSTSKGVIEKSKCPVLTIPGKTTFKIPKQILYASNFEDKDIDAIYSLQEIAQLFDAQIVIAHVITKNESGVSKKMNEFKELLKEKVAYPKIKFQLMLSNDINKSLNDYVSKNNVDLIAMIEHEEKGVIDKWFHRDLVKKMEFQTIIPLLTYNEKQLSLTAEKQVDKTQKI